MEWKITKEPQSHVSAVPWTVLLNSSSTTMQYFGLTLNGSKCMLNAVHIHAVLDSSTSLPCINKEKKEEKGIYFLLCQNIQNVVNPCHSCPKISPTAFKSLPAALKNDESEDHGKMPNDTASHHCRDHAESVWDDNAGSIFHLTSHEIMTCQRIQVHQCSSWCSISGKKAGFHTLRSLKSDDRMPYHTSCCGSNSGIWQDHRIQWTSMFLGTYLSILQYFWWL